jgi:hypothetical protein
MGSLPFDCERIFRRTEEGEATGDRFAGSEGREAQSQFSRGDGGYGLSVSEEVGGVKITGDEFSEDG